MALADLLIRSLKNTRLKPAQVPFLNQALAEAGVRYEPEWANLNQIREQSARSMRQGQQQAVSGAQLIAALAGQARQGVQQDNSPAIQQALAYQHAPEGSSTQRTGLGISLGHDATANLLAQMAGAAPIRANQQVQQLTAQHSEDLDRINAQRKSLIGQAGQYTVGRFGDLTETNRKQRADLNKQLRSIRSQEKQTESRLDVTQRGQDITKRGQDLSHQDRQAAIDARRKKDRAKAQANQFEDKYGIKPATGVQLTSAKNQIGRALAIAKTHRQQGDPRTLAANILLNGVPAFDAPGGGKVPAVKPVDQVWASVALDVAYDGHLSNKNAAALHRLGYSVKALGLPARPKTQRVSTGLGASIPLPSRS